jgi:succinate dehydrogenase/fumarate reductase flavoprotein subunit
MLTLHADVLVIGGGLAGAWAAVGAARAGASVVLAEKGYLGTSGVTATAGPGHWWVPPDSPELRARAIADRMARGGFLGEADWMARILDITWRTLPTLAPFHHFPKDEAGVTQYRALRGPEYMRAMRRLVESLGVRILDHCPALELTVADDGAVCGARGYARQASEDWQVTAPAVVLATGGCAFASRLLGSANNTGDGLLMAAEAGADFSGMEFTNAYCVAPAGTNMTRTMAYSFARYFDADGHALDIPPGPDNSRLLAEALARGPVLCSLENLPQDIRAHVPTIQPNVTVAFERAGVDPYTTRFPVTLRGEGTVRGIGGVRVRGPACETGVPGLYVAGDVATRELVTGAISGGGAQNSAWALSSGLIAGEGAAVHARRRGHSARVARPLGQAGLRPSAGARPVDLAGAQALVAAEMEDPARNMFRRGAVLDHSLTALEAAWRDVAAHASSEGAGRVRAREVAAMLAAARWSKAAALARRETRGMHWRQDAPAAEASMQARLTTGGLHAVWTRFETTPQAVAA